MLLGCRLLALRGTSKRAEAVDHLLARSFVILAQRRPLLSRSLSPSLHLRSSPSPLPFSSSSFSAASYGFVPLSLETPIQPEHLRDDMIFVSETPVSAIDFARAIANAKEKKGDSGAFMAVSLDALFERHLLWRRELPDVQPFYAMKCNSDPVLLRTLAALGHSFDCASRTEIDTMLSLDVSPTRIIYANPCKSREYIKHAKKVGVSMVNFDNKEELEKIVECDAVTDKLMLRISVPDPTAKCRLDLKFGAEPEKLAPELIRDAARRGINLRGICFHVGSSCRDASAYIKAVEYSRKFFDLAASLGMKMDILDIGGGFPGIEQHKPTFEEIASLLRPSLSAHFPSSSGVRLIGEPGRFFACPPFTLAANVTSATETNAARLTGNDADAGQKAFMYYLNEGVYGTLNCIFFDDNWPISRPLFPPKDPEEYLCTIWGPTCEAIDMLEEKKLLPRLSVGDWLFWEDMGAYTTEGASSFSGIAPLTRHYFVSQQTKPFVTLAQPRPLFSRSLSPSLHLRSYPLRLPFSSSSFTDASYGFVPLSLDTPIRPEHLRDNLIFVSEMPVSSIEFARAIANAKGDSGAFMAVSLDAFYERHLLWRRELPDVQPFYAMKCNSDPVLLRTLAALGHGFDCASRTEIDTMHSLDVSPTRIIYANPCKSREYIKHAKKVGVSMVNFDNKEELEKIVECDAVTDKLMLRISVPDPTAKCRLDLKFGAEPEKLAPELIRDAARRGINLRGICFHVGSGCADASAYIKAIEYSRELFDLAATLGMKMDILDIGGGFPGVEQHRPTFEEIASLLRTSLSDHFPSTSGVRLMNPVASSLVVPSLWSPMLLRSKRPTPRENDAEAKQKEFMYYVNDGVYGSFNCIFFDHNRPISRPLFPTKDTEEFLCTIWGPTCEAVDMLEEKKLLPRLSVGDWLFWEDMGAYTTEGASSFLGIAPPTRYYFVSQQTKAKLGV